MREESRKDLIRWASLKNINVYIDQKKILSDISLNLRYGENILILGPNGSGKSTFLKLLNRSIYPIISNQSSFKLFNKEKPWDLHPTNSLTNSVHEDRGMQYPPENPNMAIKNNRKIIIKLFTRLMFPISLILLLI